MSIEAYGVACSLIGFIIGEGAALNHASMATSVVSGIASVVVAMLMRPLVVPR